MEFVRTTVRPERLPALGMDAVTADTLAASLVRGEFIGHCDYCGRPLFEADEPTHTHAWSLRLREVLPIVSCKQCLEGNDDEPI